MNHVHKAPAKVQDVLQSFHDHQRLVNIVTTMTQEIERLNEDNAQLRAAVKIYRYVAHRGSRRLARRGAALHRRPQALNGLPILPGSVVN
jgi:hypothetical protein